MNAGVNASLSAINVDKSPVYSGLFHLHGELTHISTPVDWGKRDAPKFNDTTN